MKNYIAVDLGASSGRVILGTLKDDKISLQEAHRFENGPVEENGALHWDFESLFGNIKSGIKKAIAISNNDISGIGVDTWGVDYGLLDKQGKLIENPYNYRDSRTDGMMDKVFDIVGKRRVYDITGIQFMQLNTLYQLYETSLNRKDLLGNTDKLIFMADLVGYHLCGQKFGEYTLASTSQLMDMKTGKWSKELFDKLNLPMEVMPDVIKPATIVGKLTDQLCKELNSKPINVIAVGSHDTACAVASVPVKTDGKWAYLSSGTWSLMGIEVSNAIINDLTYKYAFTNEGGVNDTIRLLKNIMGLWLIQQCRATWKSQGLDISYSQMTEMSENAAPFFGVINPNDSRFLAPCDMPAKVNEYLKETGQKTTDNKGQILRIIQESLAYCYRWVLDKLEEIGGEKIDTLHIVGGGIQNELLCQFTADAIGRTVLAGPVEATACGNILLQAIADGQVKSITEARKIISNSFETKRYIPKDVELWNEQYKKFENIFG